MNNGYRIADSDAKETIESIPVMLGKAGTNSQCSFWCLLSGNSFQQQLLNKQEFIEEQHYDQ